MEPDGRRGARRALGRLLEAVLASRAEANAVFDILALLQVRRADAGDAGSASVPPGLGRARAFARRGSGLRWGSSPVPQGSRIRGSGGGLTKAGCEGHAGDKGRLRWGWSPGGERGKSTAPGGAPCNRPLPSV